MATVSTTPVSKYDYLLPFGLFLMPIIMALKPVLIEIGPRRDLYYTPIEIKAFLIIAVLYMLVTCAGLKPKLSGIKHLIWPGLVLLIIAFATAILRAKHQSYAIEKTLDLLLVGVFCLFMSRLILKAGPAFTNLLLWALFGGILVASVLATFLTIFEIPEYYMWPNFVPGFVYVRIFGFSLTIAIAIGVGLLATSNSVSKLVVLANFVGVTILAAILFWTSSRGGIMALMVMLPFMLFLGAAARKALLLAVIAISIGAWLSTFLPSLSSSFGFFQAIEDVVKATSANRLSAGRLDIWQEFLAFVPEYPLFGRGYGQMTLLFPGEPSATAHAHNIVVETVLAWGWVGTACAGYIYMVLLIAVFRKTFAGAGPFVIPAFLVIGCMSLYAWVDGVYFYYHVQIPFAICAAIIWSYPRVKATD